MHQVTPNPNIPFDELNLRVVDRNWSLPERRGPALAGVNSFGFGGTNAHVVLRGEDRTVAVAHPRSEAAPPPLLLSAHAEDRLPVLAQHYAEAWPSDKRLVGDFIATAAHLRDPLPHRALVRATNPAALRQQLELFAVGESAPGVLSGHALGQDLPVAFVFSGNGAQWAGMGRTAWHSNARFREALQEIDRHFLKRQKASLVDLIFADDLAPRLRQATHAQPLLLALQVATVRSLEAQGLAPQATLGHSVGEIAAAWCAGALSLEQAIDVVIARSRHQEAVRGRGGMAALMLDEREARRFLKTAAAPDVDVAAINSWRSVTVSGPVEQIEQVLGLASAQRIGARRLDLDYPFHSALVEPVRGPLLRELKGLRPLPARKRFVSSVSGAPAEGEMLGPEHWWRNVREPVQFEAGLSCLVEQGIRVFVEIGPKPILTSYLRDTLREANLRGAIIETLVETGEKDDSDPIERAVARVMIAGGQVDHQRLFGPPPVQAIPLPAYPWRHTAYRVQPTAEASSVFQAPSNPLLGSRPRRDACEWFATVDPMLFPWIADHKVGGLPLFPAAGYVEVLLAAAREVHGGSALELRDMDIVRPLVFGGTASYETLVRVTPETGIAEFLSRPRGGTGGLTADWALNARELVARSPVEERAAPDTQSTGRIVVPRAKVYEISRTLGFEYGEKFQRVRHVSFPKPKQAVAVLEANPGVAVAGQTIDITGLDAAFHSLFASEEAGVADMPMKRMLPVRFGRVRAFAPGATASRIVTRTLRQSLSSMLTDIELVDETGRLVLLAEDVRLIEAPVAAAPDARSLVYRTTRWQLERPGKSSTLSLQTTPPREPGDAKATAAAAAGEALLLLEAGCLRAAWEAFHGDAPANLRDALPAAETHCEWPAHLCSSLLWHLETKGLVVDDQGRLALAENCSLPPVGTVVRSLISRHPTMASEAAGLARIGDIVRRVVAGDATVSDELEIGSLAAARRGGAANRPAARRGAGTSAVGVGRSRFEAPPAVAGDRGGPCAATGGSICRLPQPRYTRNRHRCGPAGAGASGARRRRAAAALPALVGTRQPAGRQRRPGCCHRCAQRGCGSQRRAGSAAPRAAPRGAADCGRTRAQRVLGHRARRAVKLVDALGQLGFPGGRPADKARMARRTQDGGLRPGRGRGRAGRGQHRGRAGCGGRQRGRPAQRGHGLSLGRHAQPAAPGTANDAARRDRDRH